MTIAVLFTSANPLTDSHLSILISAVRHLNADKGLFVATNGDYLKRKMVKRGDGFCLTEEERREIIEKACDAEPNLEFWGFELGGSSPKRYKTLAKLQKQYPDATIHEVQGADKLRSISKFSDSEEYVNNVKFAIFGRDGIDLDALIDDDPLLSANKNRFTLLPALDEGAEISSTEVRRRFFAGEDYTDIVPASAVEVLSRHQPSDFTISFTERMQTLIKSGRFGVSAAQKEVYADNNQLFTSWKNGENEAYFGNYQEFIDNTKLYKTALDVSDKGEVYPSTETGCINMDCVDLAEHLVVEDYNPAILNLASAKRPCGGYAQGLSAQEESLCRSSNLSVSLFQYGDTKYKDVRDSGVPAREIGYPLDINYGGIYTPSVTFFRHGKSELYDFRIPPFRCDVISVAALSFNGRSHYADVDELSYRADNGGFTLEGEKIMLNKIRTIFAIGVEHSNDALVLGAFGCGAYRLPVADVARLFRVVMEEPKFKNRFRLIAFAIMEKSRKPNGLDGKYAPFYREFGTYVI
jgi:nicotinate (nicotinamide) nucleotide adenylyltransferase